MDLFLLYQYVITAVLVFVLLNFLVNNIFFKDISRFKLPRNVLEKNPLISILIPARNEENNIRRCITSLMKQDYRNIEILVLDDNSTDNTAQIVEELSEKDSRVILFHGKPLKKGWMGKTYACHQLAEYSRGEYLIFTDADTLHFPNSVSSAVACLLKNKLDALSVLSKQIMVTIHERMVVPFGQYMILCFMPVYLINRTRSALFCTAIGQFMLFKKGVYKKIGGHESVKGEVLDDIRISKKVKRYGYKFMIFDGRNNLYSRNYRNFKEVARGHSKTLFAVFDYKIFIISIGIMLISALFLAPFFMLLPAIFFRWPMVITELITLQITIILITKIILSIRFRCKAVDILLHPVAMIYLILIALKSIYDTSRGIRVNWKGRIYGSEENNLVLVNDNYKSKL
jgi:chlorobactene glucosyltransferase